MSESKHPTLKQAHKDLKGPKKAPKIRADMKPMDFDKSILDGLTTYTAEEIELWSRLAR